MYDQVRMIDLRDYTRLIRTRLGTVLLVGLLFAGAGAGYIIHKGHRYTASARVAIEPLFNDAANQGGAKPQLSNPLDEAEKVKSLGTVNAVRSNLKLATPATELEKNVRVSVVGTTNVMVVSYVSRDPQTATTLANAFAYEYVAQRIGSAKALINGSVANLQSELKKKQADLRRLEAQISATQDPVMKAQLKLGVSPIRQAINAIPGEELSWQNLTPSILGAEVTQKATIPTKPNGPGLPTAVVAGFIFGLIVGAGIAILRGVWADKVSGRNELSLHLGAPVLGLIPYVGSWTDPSEEELVTRQEPTALASEAYRTLATNIRFISSKKPIKSILVTSALPSEGKSATAANLAVVFAEIGIQTLLVDADLRRPRAERFLDVHPRLGLREALEGLSDADDLISPTGVPGLGVLGSGELPPDPVSLLAGQRAERVFKELTAAADLVIFDAPPVLLVADASVLAERADAVLFVHDPSISSRTALQDAVSQLQTAGGAIVGGVYNNVTLSDGSYAYYRSYGSYSSSKSDRGPASAVSTPRPQRRATPEPMIDPQARGWAADSYLERIERSMRSRD